MPEEEEQVLEEEKLEEEEKNVPEEDLTSSLNETGEKTGGLCQTLEEGDRDRVGQEVVSRIRSIGDTMDNLSCSDISEVDSSRDQTADSEDVFLTAPVLQLSSLPAPEGLLPPVEDSLPSETQTTPCVAAPPPRTTLPRHHLYTRCRAGHRLRRVDCGRLEEVVEGDYRLLGVLKSTVRQETNLATDPCFLFSDLCAPGC